LTLMFAFVLLMKCAAPFLPAVSTILSVLGKFGLLGILNATGAEPKLPTPKLCHTPASSSTCLSYASSGFTLTLPGSVPGSASKSRKEVNSPSNQMKLFVSCGAILNVPRA